MNPVLCVPLDNIRATDLAMAGGKGANLGELLHAGFAVPQGFIVTTESYREAIPAMEGTHPPGKEDVLAAAMPPNVRDSIGEHYQKLGGGLVAVRSSATAEDLPGAAFAGQQDTFLGIIGADQLLDAVQQCWASLWTDRAVAYRRRLNIDPSTVSIAVVVQRLVPAEYAGVMFTANPVTGARDDTVIDSNPGLGETVVSGLVTPDHAVLDAKGKVVERKGGLRESVIVSDAAGGTTTLSGDSDTASLAPIADTDLARLAQIGRRIAEHFGRPQDIEWALNRGEFAILQARPMTALPPAPIRLNRIQRAIGPTILELIPRRPYPLELSFWIKDDVGMLVDGMLEGLIGLRLDFDQVLPSEDSVVQSYVPPVPRPTRFIPIRLVRSLWRMRLDPAGWAQDPRHAHYLSETARLDELVLAKLDWNKLVGVPVSAASVTDLVTALRVVYLPAAGGAIARLNLLLKLLHLGQHFGSLLVDGRTQTALANSAIERLATVVRDDPALAKAFGTLQGPALRAWVESDTAASGFRAMFVAFLKQFGHRESTSILLLRDPTWIDSPSIVLDLIGAMASGPATIANAKSLGHEPDGAIALSAKNRVLGTRLLRAFGMRNAVSRLIRKAAAGAALREDTHFEASRPMPVVRRAMVEIGTRLAAAGALDDPDDVWFLSWPEIQSVEDPGAAAAREPALADSVSRRRSAYAELSGSPLIARSTLYRARTSVEGALVTGSGGGGGIATGPARIVHGPEEFGLLRTGDVLVCPSTSPAWTPLFALACAVVVDNGGLASHAAIVAREYGIPAVMGCGSGTSTLTDGQLITVDGTRGIVVAAHTPEDTAI